MPNNPGPQFPMPQKKNLMQHAHDFGDLIKSVAVGAFWFIIAVLVFAVTIVALITIIWATKTSIHALNGF